VLTYEIKVRRNHGEGTSLGRIYGGYDREKTNLRLKSKGLIAGLGRGRQNSKRKHRDLKTHKRMSARGGEKKKRDVGMIGSKGWKRSARIDTSNWERHAKRADGDSHNKLP